MTNRTTDIHCDICRRYMHSLPPRERIPRANQCDECGPQDSFADQLMALVFKYGAARCDVDRSNTAKNQRVCNEAIAAIRSHIAALSPPTPTPPHGGEGDKQ